MDFTEQRRFEPLYQRMQQSLVLQGLRQSYGDHRNQTAADSKTVFGGHAFGVVINAAI